jgi:hypothetical protein
MLVTTGTRWVRSLAVVTLLLGAAACSADPPPPGAVKTSTPTVQTSTPAPTPTVTPVEQQIEAAVRAYYAELGHAIQTGATSKLNTMMLKSCPCHGSVTSIDRLAAKNQRAPGAQIDIIRLHVHDVIAQSSGADVSYNVSAYDLVGADGTLQSHIRARRDHVDLSLILSSDHWLVANVFNLGGR